jgi:hypothetical protein
VANFLYLIHLIFTCALLEFVTSAEMLPLALVLAGPCPRLLPTVCTIIFRELAVTSTTVLSHIPNRYNLARPIAIMMSFSIPTKSSPLLRLGGVIHRRRRRQHERRQRRRQRQRQRQQNNTSTSLNIGVAADWMGASTRTINRLLFSSAYYDL